VSLLGNGLIWWDHDLFTIYEWLFIFLLFFWEVTFYDIVMN
jgi:hypothetical protein